METNKSNVKSQLMYEWDEEKNEDGEYVEVKGKQLMTESEAGALIAKHQNVYDRCCLMHSFAYYTANEIRKAENGSA